MAVDLIGRRLRTDARTHPHSSRTTLRDSRDRGTEAGLDCLEHHDAAFERHRRRNPDQVESARN